jgi:hypothetical protein
MYLAGSLAAKSPRNHYFFEYRFPEISLVPFSCRGDHPETPPPSRRFFYFHSTLWNLPGMLLSGRWQVCWELRRKHSSVSHCVCPSAHCLWATRRRLSFESPVSPYSSIQNYGIYVRTIVCWIGVYKFYKTNHENQKI